jgi:hypothetical protein
MKIFLIGGDNFQKRCKRHKYMVQKSTAKAPAGENKIRKRKAIAYILCIFGRKLI